MSQFAFGAGVGCCAVIIGLQIAIYPTPVPQLLEIIQSQQTQQQQQQQAAEQVASTKDDQSVQSSSTSSITKKTKMGRAWRRGGPVGHHTMKYGIPESDIIREYPGLVIQYDYRTRTPKWVAEHLTKQQVYINNSDRQKSTFIEDYAIDSRFRQKGKYYKRSGFSRGHMAPAMDHQASQTDMQNTFTYSNIVPQVHKGFNSSVWMDFESWVKRLTNQFDDVYVYTGPMYIPALTANNAHVLQHDALGPPPRQIHVPTHLYKVILAEKKSPSWFPGKKHTTRAIGAFVMANQSTPDQQQLDLAAVPLQALEDFMGIKFFPKLKLDSRTYAACDKLPRNLEREAARKLPSRPPPKLLPQGGSSAEADDERGRGRRGKKQKSDTQDEENQYREKGVNYQYLCDATSCKLDLSQYSKYSNKYNNKYSNKSKKSKAYSSSSSSSFSSSSI